MVHSSNSWIKQTRYFLMEHHPITVRSFLPKLTLIHPNLKWWDKNKILPERLIKPLAGIYLLLEPTKR